MTLTTVLQVQRKDTHFVDIKHFKLQGIGQPPLEAPGTFDDFDCCASGPEERHTFCRYKTLQTLRDRSTAS
jgi:hypothetical protein